MVFIILTCLSLFICSHIVFYRKTRSLTFSTLINKLSGQNKGKGAGIEEEERKRRTRNGEGATKSSKKGGSCVFSSSTSGNN